MLIHDPDAEKRSLMERQKALCNGQKTGRACVHYWVHVEKVESNNPDNLRFGQFYRGCGWHASIMNEMSQSQLAVACNQYAPRLPPGQETRKFNVLHDLPEDPGAYNENFEDYKPLTPEEIKELQKEDEVTAPTTEETVNNFQEEVVEPAKELSTDDALKALEEAPE